MTCTRSWPLALLLAACGEPGADTPADVDDTDVDDTEIDDTDVDAPNDDTDDPVDDPAPTTRTRTYDATDGASFVYVDLGTGGAVDPAAPWHVALSRTRVLTHGGALVGLAEPRDDLYDPDGAPIPDAFLDVDPALTLALLEGDLPEPSAWVGDAIAAALGEDWYVYDLSNGNVSENADVGFVVRGGEGTSHARLRTVDLDFPTRAGQGIQRFAFELEVQADGSDTLAPPVTFEGTLASGAVCYDFDAAETVPCTGTAWDLQLGFAGRSFFLHTNSGDAGDGDGGAAGPYDWATLSTWTRASHDPAGDAVRLTADLSRSLIDEEGWYAYGLQGGHRLWPNHRVWVIDADGAGTSGPRFALQILDYYDGAGASGHVTLRWRALGEPAPR